MVKNIDVEQSAQIYIKDDGQTKPKPKPIHTGREKNEKPNDFSLLFFRFVQWFGKHWSGKKEITHTFMRIHNI